MEDHSLVSMFPDRAGVSALTEDRHSPVLPPRKPALPGKGQVSMPTTHYTNNAPTQLPGPARRNPKEGRHLATPDSPARLAEVHQKRSFSFTGLHLRRASGRCPEAPCHPSPEAGLGRSLLQPPRCN